MTDTIEPTEEQKQAARHMWMQAYDDDDTIIIGDIARLLAEREHKLREEQAATIEAFHDATRVRVAAVRQLRDDLDAARARIAELEESLTAEEEITAHLRDLKAAHLAHIKALREALQGARPSVEAWVTGDGDDSDCDALQTVDEVLADTAHYDVEGEGDK
jgi:predicted  nucleic acid-binding Zn-ribbon protein